MDDGAARGWVGSAIYPTTLDGDPSALSLTLQLAFPISYSRAGNTILQWFGFAVRNRAETLLAQQRQNTQKLQRIRSIATCELERLSHAQGEFRQSAALKPSAKNAHAKNEICSIF